ncbi:hypothetical protein GA0115236_103216 [Streptomyces sp. IgraMP-1]|nr:hypothetical protein GA0115236_103216 [Streptomyces sp. IgraMP-1]
MRCGPSRHCPGPRTPVPALQDRPGQCLGRGRVGGGAWLGVGEDEFDLAQFREAGAFGDADQAGRDQAAGVGHHAESGAGGGQQAVEAAAGAGDPPGPAVALQGVQRPGPRDAGHRVDDERDRVLRVEPQPVRADPHQPVAADQRRGRVRGAALGEDQVELARRQPLVERAGELHGQLQLHLGMVAAERLQDLRQPGQHEVLRGAEPQPSAQPRPAEVGGRLLLDLQDAAGETEHGRPVAGQLHGVGVPQEERPPHLFLQPPHVLADGGLAHAEPPGRLGEAQGLRDGEEGAQQRGIVHTAHVIAVRDDSQSGVRDSRSRGSGGCWRRPPAPRSHAGDRPFRAVRAPVGTRTDRGTP